MRRPVEAAALRSRIDAAEILVAPGAGGPLEARLIEAAGFEAIYVSGYSLAATLLGVPDIGLVGPSDLVETVSRIAAVTTKPLIVDADTGYGDVASVAFNVRRLEDAGAAGIQIEDQQWPKRCGHLDGKHLVARDEMERKVAAAVAARQNEDTVIIARTDAIAVAGFDEAVERVRAYRQAGADVVFLDAPESDEQLVAIPGLLDAPTLVNMSESGRTPLRSAAELQGLGYAVAIFPTAPLRIAAHAISGFLAELRRSGDSRPAVDHMTTLADLNAAVGLGEFADFEARVTRER